jgi:hypothetical protein
MGSVKSRTVRNLVSALLLVSASISCAFAQQPEPPTSAKEAGGKHLIEKNNLTPAEKASWWKGYAVDPEGFIVESSPGRVKLIDEARQSPYFKKEIEPAFAGTVGRMQEQGFPIIGGFRENEHRYTMLFGDSSSGFVMYTIFAYKDAGGAFTVASDFAKYKVNDSPAILVLSVDTEAQKGLWKLTTWLDGVAHEMYITDRLTTRGRPIRKPHDVIKIGDAVFR